MGLGHYNQAKRQPGYNSQGMRGLMSLTHLVLKARIKNLNILFILNLNEI